MLISLCTFLVAAAVQYLCFFKEVFNIYVSLNKYLPLQISVPNLMT